MFQEPHSSSGSIILEIVLYVQGVQGFTATAAGPNPSPTAASCKSRTGTRQSYREPYNTSASSKWNFLVLLATIDRTVYPCLKEYPRISAISISSIYGSLGDHLCALHKSLPLPICYPIILSFRFPHPTFN